MTIPILAVVLIVDPFEFVEVRLLQLVFLFVADPSCQRNTKRGMLGPFYLLSCASGRS